MSCAQDASDAADPAAALKLLDAAAASAAAAEVARCGVALHDGLIAEGQQLREARLRALAGAHDTSMVRVTAAVKRVVAPGLVEQPTQPIIGHQQCMQTC
jgi:hypothetical protein